MEEETEVYVFDQDQQYKENNFDLPIPKLQAPPQLKVTINQNLLPNKKQYPQSILKQRFPAVGESKDQDQSDEEQQQEQQYDEHYSNNNSARKEYEMSKNAQKIEDYHKSQYKTNFYQIQHVTGDGEGKQVLNITNSHQFIVNPLHPNIILECSMVKVKNGLFNYSWEIYSQNKFLISVHKVPGIVAKYKVYSHKKACDSNYVGRIQANFMGTQWFIFDNGTNPETSRNFENVRKMFGSVNYKSNFFRRKGLRKMEVYLPLPIQGSLKKLSCLENTNILKTFYDKETPIVSRFTNKLPEYNQQTGEYRQDFGGKIKTTSIKNMIIADQETGKQRLLFGKIAEDAYYFEARYPFSPLQAAGVSISSVQGKIGVQ